MLDIEAIKRRLGPVLEFMGDGWTDDGPVVNPHVYAPNAGNGNGGLVCMMYNQGEPITTQTKSFIAHSVDDIRDLIAEVERLTNDLHRYLGFSWAIGEWQAGRITDEQFNAQYDQLNQSDS